MNLSMLTLKVISPLALHLKRASEQFAPTLDYVPGSAIRGAFADLYLAGHTERAEEETFRRLFFTGETTFSDFLPVPAGERGLSRLIPATAKSCKRFTEHEDSAITDSLLRLELVRELIENNKDEVSKPLTQNGWEFCPTCRDQGRDGIKRDRLESGYYTSLDVYQPVKVRKRMVSSTAINRVTGAAAHAMLFSHEVIEESLGAQSVCFRGLVTAPDDLRAELEALAPPEGRLAVGYGRSRGLGQLEVDGWETPPAERLPLQTRLRMLNKAVGDFWSCCDCDLRGRYFTLTLQSHLILRDDAGQPVTDGIGADHLGLAPGATRCRSVLNAVSVSGWNAALGLPKPDAWAIGRGSVLLFHLPPDADEKRLLSRLAEIETLGVGERRGEGYGRVIACDPFHYHFLQRELNGG